MTKRRGGRADQSARQALAARAIGSTCRRCGLPIMPGQSWDAGHLHDLALGGNPAGPVEPEHSHCNRAAGARLRNQQPQPRRPRVEAWLPPVFLASDPHGDPATSYFLPTPDPRTDPAHAPANPSGDMP